MKTFKGIKDSFPNGTLILKKGRKLSRSHLSVIKEIESVVDNVPAGG